MKIGVSLKLYFGYAETIAWCRRVARIVSRHPAAQTGAAEVFLLPTAPALGVVQTFLAKAGIRLGAQCVSCAEHGAFTGEVGAPFLRELGCDYAEIGHAERRQMFGETEDVIAAKVAVSVRHGLIPLLCVGEPERTSPARAARYSIRQVKSALSSLAGSGPVKLVVAYEPIWAIGASQPAAADHIMGVGRRLQAYLDGSPRLRGSCVIYGGSAGPGLLTSLHGAVSGLFLGRFAHDTRNLTRILDEVAALSHR